MPKPLTGLEPKQCTLIRRWMARADDDRDYYGKFISLWIAFNAMCYALYASEANRRRADLKNDKGLASIGETQVETHGSMRAEGGKIRIELLAPGRITLDLVEKYTEDLIFSAFAKDYASKYEEWLQDREFRHFVTDFQKAMQKPDDAHYIINMARILEFTQQRAMGEPERYLRKPLVCLFEDINDFSALKDVLYQVRCNIFHGEKVPGEPNDDRIVHSAYPVLFAIMSRVTADLPIH